MVFESIHMVNQIDQLSDFRGTYRPSLGVQICDIRGDGQVTLNGTELLH